MKARSRVILSLLQAVPLVLLALVFLLFSALSSRFLSVQNAVNILVQSASLALVATGMTFVLITGGIDLSVGSIMFLSAAIAGKMVLSGWPLGAALAAVLAAGVLCGAVNAIFIRRFRILPFVVTLSTLYVGRGLALHITETRAMNLPETLLRLGTGTLAGVPLPLWILGPALAAAHFALTRTPFGRQLYALGNNAEAAQTAGIAVGRLTSAVYLISGFCAALGGLVAVAQLGAVSPTFGNQREFAAIAAAVLGGTSLFGGRGNVLPGTLLGAVLLQTIESGLVIVNADPYLYPLIMASIIFLAVLLDGARHKYLQKLGRRRIRPLGHEKI